MQSLAKADYSGYLKGITNKVKQYALNLSEVELKVEEATNNEPWGPHGTVMGEIAKAAYDVEGYKQIMGVIARRLQDTGESWRHVYKSLLLLEFMAKHGPQKVVEELVSNVTVIEKLQSFQHKDKNGKDWGLNVRQRAKELANLVLDGERIRNERSKAKVNETKYKGVSSEDWRSGAIGSKSGLGSGGGGMEGGFGGSRLQDDENFDYGSLTKGRGKGAGIGSSTGGKTPSDDAVAATKARIDALRKDGNLDESPRKADAIPAVSASKPPARPATAAAAPDSSQRQPKKLSDVKPTVQLSLGNFAPPPSATPAAAAPASAAFAASSVAAATPAAPAATQAKAPAAHVGDLLGSMTLDRPVAPSTGAKSTAGPSDWSQFSAPAAAAAAPADDPFANFGEGRSAGGAAPAASADPFGGSDPFGSTPNNGGFGASDPFGASAPTQAKPSNDPFATHSAAPQGAPTRDPFGLSTPAPTSAADPFADFAAAPRSTAKPNSDPFAVSGASSNGNTPRSPTKAALPEDLFSAPPPQPQRQQPRPQAAFGMQQFPQGMTGFPGAGGPGFGFPAPGQQGFPGMVGFMPQPGMPFPGASPQAGFQQYNAGMQMGGFQSPQQYGQGQKTPTGLLPQQVPGSPSVGSLGLSGLTVPPSGAASAKKDPFADLSAF